MRYAIFVHDPDGDSGYGAIVGPFYDPEKAEEKAKAIDAKSFASMHGAALESIVLPVLPSKTSIAGVIEQVDRS